MFSSSSWLLYTPTLVLFKVSEQKQAGHVLYWNQ